MTVRMTSARRVIEKVFDAQNGQTYGCKYRTGK
jgi:hypothetical protein